MQVLIIPPEQLSIIDSDLEFITELTKDFCLFTQKGDVILDEYSPKELFQQRVDQKDLFKDISFDGIKTLFDGDELTKGLGDLLLYTLNQISLEEQFRVAFENPEVAKQLDVMFPGLRDNPTMEGFFKSFNDMIIGMNDDEKYKDLRQIMQSGLGINRDRLYDTQSPYDVIDSMYKPLGAERYQPKNDDKIAPMWYNDVVNEYIFLDMHGYQEDRVNIKKGRKETFRNTTEDAFHAAFATTCNFYIINDKKSYKKVKQVYEKLGINTLVLKPDEFVDYYRKYLHFENPLYNVALPIGILKSNHYIEEKLEDAVLRTYHFPYFIFNFFTKLLILVSDSKNYQPTILLSRNKPTNGATYTMEIRKLISNINSILGMDIHRKGEMMDEEFKEEEWSGREWQHNEITFTLRNPNRYFQLYIDFKL